MPEFKSDPENYYKMAEPHENETAANEAVKKFYEELSELRKKYKLRDVYVILNDSMRNDDGSVGEFMVSSSFGDGLKPIQMVAWAFGQEQAQHKSRISQLVAGELSKRSL